ncbi:glycosyl transferase family protein [Cellvibrio sp. BR]|nr:glycosyl transferase family protein [Cellvibrio sp. BR]
MIPLFNRAQYIEETIHSVLSQDYPNIQLIVIDDGSSDGGDLLVQAIADQTKLILLRHPGNVNKGQAAALNLGLTMATGEFIAVLDSDDLYAPGKIAKQVAFFQQNPEVGLVYGNGKGIDAAGNVIYEINYDNRIERSDPNDLLLDCYFLLPQNSLVRASVYQQAGNFDETLRSGQDHDMLIRLAEKTKIAHQSIDSFRYRRHGDSISAKGTETRWRCGLIILEKAAQRYPYQKSTLRKRRALVNFRLAQALYQKKTNRFEMVWRMLLAGLLDPVRSIAVVTGKEKIR